MILKCVVNNVVFRVLSKYIFNERFHFVLILFFSFLVQSCMVLWFGDVLTEIFYVQKKFVEIEFGFPEQKS